MLRETKGGGSFSDFHSAIRQKRLMLKLASRGHVMWPHFYSQHLFSFQVCIDSSLADCTVPRADAIDITGPFSTRRSSCFNLLSRLRLANLLSSD